MRAVLTAIGGLAVLVTSFWLTLQAIDHWPPWRASDFDVAMTANGFTMSDTIVGSVEAVRRDQVGRLQLAGWAFDKELAQPVSVLVLVGAKFQQIALTNGTRPDLTQYLQQSAERTKNVVFSGLTSEPVGCGPHTVVAVNQKKLLSILAYPLMVPRCTS
jgi:hypothetical protein